MRKKIVLLLLFVAGSLSALQAQNVALKTNLLCNHPIYPIFH